MNKVTEEERKKMLEKEDYDKKKTKKEKETRGLYQMLNYAFSYTYNTIDFV